VEDFHFIMIKPTHYDDDGYPIQWLRSAIPSNTLACLNGLAEAAIERKALGPDVRIHLHTYDETNTRVKPAKIIRMIRQSGGKALIGLVGVQSNQFPRAVDLAQKFLKADLPVAIGGFHVSGCMSMLKEMPQEMVDAQKMGITFFAGEAEDLRLDDVFRHAYAGELKPIYNFMSDLPSLDGEPTPILPSKHIQFTAGSHSSFDLGRGCPFQCSFCTIINVQGRKSRWRDADDIETLIRANHAQGIHSFFITDDNFARNKNWEPIFDRIIELREKERINIRFLIQVDTLAHRLPNFIEKAAKAGCTNVFIGLESINPENLAHMKKGQNRITEYRKMFQMWKEHGIMTYAGFIMGLPNDTPESIRRDIELIKRELPVDVLEFTMLTPLPGSEDHKVLYEKGTWLDPDLNRYDLEHATIEHPKMSKEVWQQTYEDIWGWYYTDEHIETLMRRNMAYGIKPVRVWRMCLQIYGAMHFEGVHPQQCGYLRLKDPEQRRPGFKRIPSFLFYPVFAVDSLIKYVKFGAYAWKLNRMRMRIQKDKSNRNYTDLAIKPVVEGEEESLEMFELNDASRAAVAKAKKQKQILQGSRAKDEVPLDAAQ